MSNPTQDRDWFLSLYRDEYGNPRPEGFTAAHFREECRETFLEVEAICHRLGGQVAAQPIREQDDLGLWHTTGYKIVWQSFAPGRRAKVEVRADPPEAEIVPLAEASAPLTDGEWTGDPEHDPVAA